MTWVLVAFSLIYLPPLTDPQWSAATVIGLPMTHDECQAALALTVRGEEMVAGEDTGPDNAKFQKKLCISLEPAP
jgi:hypothetical protein